MTTVKILTVANHHSTLASTLDGLLKSLFDPLELGMEVERSSLLECEFQLNDGMIGRDASSSYGLEGCGPDIRSEERGRDVGIVEIEEGCGE